MASSARLPQISQFCGIVSSSKILRCAVGSDPRVVFWRLLRAAMHTLSAAIRALAVVPPQLRENGLSACGCAEIGVAVVTLFDQGGGLIVRPVKMRHGPDMGSRSPRRVGCAIARSATVGTNVSEPNPGEETAGGCVSAG